MMMMMSEFVQRRFSCLERLVESSCFERAEDDLVLSCCARSLGFILPSKQFVAKSFSHVLYYGFSILFCFKFISVGNVSFACRRRVRSENRFQSSDYFHPLPTKRRALGLIKHFQICLSN